MKSNFILTFNYKLSYEVSVLTIGKKNIISIFLISSDYKSHNQDLILRIIILMKKWKIIILMILMRKGKRKREECGTFLKKITLFVWKILVKLS